MWSYCVRHFISKFQMSIDNYKFQFVGIKRVKEVGKTSTILHLRCIVCHQRCTLKRKRCNFTLRRCKTKRLKSGSNAPEPLFICGDPAYQHFCSGLSDRTCWYQNDGNDIRQNTARRRDETTYKCRINSRISKTSAIDTFCDKPNLQKTYTPQGKIGGQKGGFVIDFVIIWKLAENRSQKHDMKE